MKDFKDLKVWEKAHQLTLDVYRTTTKFPREEQYALTSQVRRSSASIAANLAEGCGRGSDAQFGRFVQIAMGSASETEYHLILCRDLNRLSKDDYERLRTQVEEVKRMLTGLLEKLKADRGMLIACARASVALLRSAFDIDRPS
jgi:four helix bundle protein